MQTAETAGIHRETRRSCFPAFFSSEVLPTFGQYKDKPLYTRVEGYTTRVFGFGVWDTVSDVLDLGSLTPLKCLKGFAKVVLVLALVFALFNWRYHSTFTERDAMARDLAVLHPNYKGPIFLHLLSYQNTGSEFIGKIFDLYQDAFYVHDPLEMVYTSVFGIPPNSDRVLPNNIFFDTEGEFRNLSKVEQGLDLWTMDKIYHCKMSDLPTAMLTSPYWSTYASKHMVNTVQYVTCLGRHEVRMDPGHESFRECQAHIKDPICPATFSTKSGYDRCGRILFTNGTFTTKDSDALWETPSGKNPMIKYRKNFQKYFDCMAALEDSAKKCASWHLDGVCKNKQYRVIKTTRVTMRMAEKFLKAFPNYRVVHIFRDPRAVTFSRLQSASPLAFAPFESPEAHSLAQSYCSILYVDKITRIRLQHIYFDRVIGLFYDKFTRDVSANMNWLVTHMNFKKKKSKVSLDYAVKSASYVDVQREKWRKGLDNNSIHQVQAECSKLLRNLQLCFTGMRCVEYSLED